jgi:hypothetical protein
MIALSIWSKTVVVRLAETAFSVAMMVAFIAGLQVSGTTYSAAKPGLESASETSAGHARVEPGRHLRQQARDHVFARAHQEDHPAEHVNHQRHPVTVPSLRPLDIRCRRRASIENYERSSREMCRVLPTDRMVHGLPAIPAWQAGARRPGRRHMPDARHRKWVQILR